MDYKAITAALVEARRATIAAGLDCVGANEAVVQMAKALAAADPGFDQSAFFAECGVREPVAMKTVTNIMSGKEIEIPADTPFCCDPSNETYWCM